jgi:hypothetical protein
MMCTALNNVSHTYMYTFNHINRACKAARHKGRRKSKDSSSADETVNGVTVIDETVTTETAAMGVVSTGNSDDTAVATLAQPAAATAGTAAAVVSTSDDTTAAANTFEVMVHYYVACFSTRTLCWLLSDSCCMLL